MTKIEEALWFACGAHTGVGQLRKYTNTYYIEHPMEVSNILCKAGYEDVTMHCAALLHDVVEDTAVTHGNIESLFGTEVSKLVEWLTDVSKPSDGNREARKAIDRAHIAKAPAEAKTIKLADLISNTKSIVQYDPDFAKVYLQEKMLLLEVLKGGDQALWHEAYHLASQGLMDIHLGSK